MNVISISTDRNIFKEGSAVRARQTEYAALFSEMHIVIFSRASHGVPEKIQIAPNAWVYATNSLSRFLYMKDAARIARRIISERGLAQHDTVVTTQDPFETGRVGARLKRDCGLPLHIQIHTDFLSPYFKKVGSASARLLAWYRVFEAWKNLERADAIRVVSTKIVDSMRAQKNLKCAAMPHLLPIFVDTARIGAMAIDSGTDLHAQYPQFNCIVLMTTRLTVEKNIPLALEAFAKAAVSRRGPGLVIIGDGPEKTRLQALVRELGIGSRIIFEGWQEQVIGHYKTADLFLSTSWYEGYGLSMVEAAAAGCPMVATDAGVARDLIGAENVCEPGDTACVAEKIARCIDDADYRATLKKRASQAISHLGGGGHAAYLVAYQKSIASALAPHTT